jgi:predicted peroxiredoxin
MAASCLVAGSLLSATSAQAEDHVSQVDKALIILTSPSLQTQGMAMVLGNAMQAKGVNVDVLLCDTAGDLALTANTSQALKPKNVTPVQLMSKLQKNGGNVSVCALYLPNSEHTVQDLREGINVATPPEMAQMMTAEQVRVYSF